jgi:class 3 adenylate cyclase
MGERVPSRGLPLYLDRHDIPGVSPEELAAAHVQDLGVQDEHGVRYLTYWFESETGAVFCLAEGPSKEAINEVHRKSHGLQASTIIEVEPGPVSAFFGSIPSHPPGEPYEESAVRAVLFTDMCGSTALAHTLGDAASTALVREHDEIVRTALGRHEGREVKHTGDGIMASFTAVSEAVQAAIGIQDAMAARNETASTSIELRVGISAGEPVSDRDDLYGAAVNLAARLCAVCKPNGITVSVAVRELCIGKLLQFGDGGRVELKGFPEPTQVYEVVWR